MSYAQRARTACGAKRRAHPRDGREARASQWRHGFRDGATLRPSAWRDDRATPGWRAGALAAVTQLGSGELLAALLPRARSPVSGLGQILVDLLPGPGVDMAGATVQAKDKALLRAALAGAALGSGYLAARAEARGWGRGRWLLAGQGLIGGAAAASRPENSSTSSLLAGLGAAAAGAGTLAVT